MGYNHDIVKDFRKQDFNAICEAIESGRDILLLGMRRVGINEMLRLFAPSLPYPGQIVDLGSLSQLTNFNLWLTILRVFRSIANRELEQTTLRVLEARYLDAITHHSDQLLLLVLIDYAEAIGRLRKNHVLVLSRFDRLPAELLTEAINFIVSAKERFPLLNFVLTSHKDIRELAQLPLEKMYILPLNRSELKLQLKYWNINSYPENIFELSGGHSYLAKTIATGFTQDSEAVEFICDEIWASLSKADKQILIDYPKGSGGSLSTDYLARTGILTKNGVFAEVFANFIAKVATTNSEKVQLNSAEQLELTKKELSLLELLLENQGSICSRDSIVATVWPEVSGLGVSDWAIDKLVARLRAKLRSNGWEYQVKTVKSRGFKLL